MKNILLIDKPSGWTSFDVVAKVRGLYKEKTGKKVKVGHAGTLDPFATGLLIVLIGDATKEQDKFMKLNKEYEAMLELGKTSTTGDPEGEITSGNVDFQPTIKQINEVLGPFKGEIEQIPPRFSAIKVAGERAYKLARKNIDFKLQSRKIYIEDIKIINYQYPCLKLLIGCSSGTYIRTLGEDIGEKLGTGAYLTDLRRTKIGKYPVSGAIEISQLEGEIKKLDELRD